MNIFRIGMVCGELFLVGLNIKLMVFSFGKQHYDALFAEISYAMFVLYAVWVHAHRLDENPTWGSGLIILASALGIIGLLGICKQLMETGSYTNGKTVSSIVKHTPVVRRIVS